MANIMQGIERDQERLFWRLFKITEHIRDFFRLFNIHGSSLDKVRHNFKLRSFNSEQFKMYEELLNLAERLPELAEVINPAAILPIGQLNFTKLRAYLNKVTITATTMMTRDVKFKEKLNVLMNSLADSKVAKLSAKERREEIRALSGKPLKARVKKNRSSKKRKLRAQKTGDTGSAEKASRPPLTLPDETTIEEFVKINCRPDTTATRTKDCLLSYIATANKRRRIKASTSF